MGGACINVKSIIDAIGNDNHFLKAAACCDDMLGHKLRWTDHRIGKCPFRLFARRKCRRIFIIQHDRLPIRVENVLFTDKLVDDRARRDHLFNRSPQALVLAAVSSSRASPLNA